MANVGTSYVNCRQVRCVVWAVFLTVLGAAAVRASGAQVPGLRFESSATGEIRLDARGVNVAEVLRAIAEEGGFEVLIDERIPRPLVNLTMPMAPIEDVLRQILRGRNHALVYDGDTASLSQVIVLAPSSPRRPGLASFRLRNGAGVRRTNPRR